MNVDLENGQTEGETLGLLEDAGECCGYLPFSQHNSRLITLPSTAAAAQDEMIQILTQLLPTLTVNQSTTLNILTLRLFLRVPVWFNFINVLMIFKVPKGNNK